MKRTTMARLLVCLVLGAIGSLIAEAWQDFLRGTKR